MPDRLLKLLKTIKLLLKIYATRTAEAIKAFWIAQEMEFNSRSFQSRILAEGTAVQDLLNPDRIIIGGDSTAGGKSQTRSC
jgi:UDPglucose 6-dehydrogenase